jgi:glyoxylase-like metal-dependent hydrolase (beta-lactamase superfamily II)
MPPTTEELRFDTDFNATPGVPVTLGDGVVRVTAPNAGPFTFTGTNSYLIGGERLAVVDPGPEDDSHLRALVDAIGGRVVEAIILTHTHRDHSDLARRLRQEVGAPIWSNGPHRLSRQRRMFEWNATGRESDFALVPDRVIGDGDRLEVGGMVLSAIATPGHCANHLAFALEATDTLFSGDHVMGWSSSIVSVPDGDMGDYLDSLDKIAARPERRYLPGHGGAIADGPVQARGLKAHREARNGQVIAAVAAGATTLGDLRARIYPTLTGRLRIAAETTLKAHVEYQAARGEIAMRAGWFGVRVGLR